MPDESQVIGQQVTVKSITVVEPPPVPEVYANNVTPAITTFDVTLHFGTIVEVTNNEAKVARRVSVVLTPEVAKLLLVHLSMGLTHYEKNVRPISLQQLLSQQPEQSSPPQTTG
jgi:hypothetical protein